MVDKIDFGIASYENPDKLKDTISSIMSHTEGDWRCLIVDNNSSDPRVREIIETYSALDERIIPMFLEENVGYAGAVNKIFEWAETDYIGYCDNDITIKTKDWSSKMINIMKNNPEVAMVFGQGHAAGGAYAMDQPGFTEILWGIGCFWITTREAYDRIGGFDEELGHQEEVDYQQRLRMAGFKIALSDVQIHHHASATMSPEAEARISAGVVNWVNKWCKYFTGELVNYHSPNVLRFEDWPPVALYLEEYWKRFLPDLNDDPEQTIIDGREYDLNRVPRRAYGGTTLYRGRII